MQAHRDSAIAALRCVIAPSAARSASARRCAPRSSPQSSIPSARSRAARFALEQRRARRRATRAARAARARARGQAGCDSRRAPRLRPSPRRGDSPGAQSRSPTPSPPRARAAARGDRGRPPLTRLRAEDTSSSSRRTWRESAPTAIYLTPAPPRRPPVDARARRAPPRTRAEPSTVKAVPPCPLEPGPGRGAAADRRRAPALLTWERIQAVGVALVAGLAPKPIVVIDLALNWADASDGVLEVLRLRSDSFRARAHRGRRGQRARSTARAPGPVTRSQRCGAAARRRRRARPALPRVSRPVCVRARSSAA